MSETQILAAHTDKFAAIRIVGRVNFKVSEPLRDFGLKVIDEGVEAVVLELSECEGMDSTILGVIAMIGLEARGKAEVVILNAGGTVRKTMDIVGVSRLCKFAQKPVAELNWQNLCEAAAGAADTRENAATILEAHRTLMDIDAGNVPKFKDVVELLEQEVEADNDK